MIHSQNRSSVRIAVESDSAALADFYRFAYNETEAVSKVYVRCALNNGRTYVLDAGMFSPFIVSAITVIPNESVINFFAFGGTVPPLRKRGFFRDTVRAALCEEKKRGALRFVAFSGSGIKSSFWEALGLSFPSYALECILSPTDKRKCRFKSVSAGGSALHFLRESHLGKDGFSDKAFFDSFAYFRSKGGFISLVGDGYLSYIPSEEKRGEYYVADCAVNADILSKLPNAFKKCIVPMSYKDELTSKGIKYNVVLNALTNFDSGNEFFNAMFRF